ncbi:MAG: hypothetical protein NTX85_02785 [Candidatus Nomurabacteria bacterium]|nr:hypothetical protein [Candidatus Nomurabacteria bacterium]
MRKFFKKIIKENVLIAKHDHKKDLRYFYNLRVKKIIKNKIDNENKWYKNYKEKITEVRIEGENKNQIYKNKIYKILTNLKNINYNFMKKILSKLNKVLRKNFFAIAPRFAVAVLIVSTIFSFSYNPQKAYAATCVTLSPGSYTATTFNTAVSSCIAGSNDIVISGAVTFAAGTYNIGSANLVINNGGTLTVQSSSTTSTGATGVIISGSGNVTVNTGGTITGVGTGYAGGTGEVSGYGEGGGIANGTIGYFSGAGGAHGGAGGRGNDSSASGSVKSSAYDTYNAPVRPGSGGAGTGSGGKTGTAGGGAIKLSTTGTVTLNGSINMSGANYTTAGSNCPGVGAGGSIWIVAGTLAGSNAGLLSANAGAFDNVANCATNPGGGAGGGMIYLDSTNDTYAGSITVASSAGIEGGETGTVGRNVVTPGNILITGNSTVTWTRTNSPSNVSGDFKFSNLQIDSGSTITTGSAEASGVGANNPGPVVNVNGGPLPGQTSYNGGGGGGHAGAGANGDYGYGGLGGSSDGGGSQVSAPTYMGSSGGGKFNSGYSLGGAGAGALKLTITGTLTNNGSINANGGSVTGGGGGGSGGSIWINSPTGIVTGTGSYTANGGNGGDGYLITPATYPSGGSGGRISFTAGATFSSFSPSSLTASAGTAYRENTHITNNGAAGTVSGVVVSSVTTPTAGSFNNSTGFDSGNKITGTAGDYGGGTISSVQVSIKNNTTGFCWNGTNFTTAACDNWINVTSGTTSWYYTGLTSSSLTNGVNYTIKSKATSSGGTETPGSGTTFTYDSSNPTSTISSPSTGTYSSSTTVSLSGTSSDTNLSTTTISVDGGAFVAIHHLIQTFQQPLFL